MELEELQTRPREMRERERKENIRYIDDRPPDDMSRTTHRAGPGQPACGWQAVSVRNGIRLHCQYSKSKMMQGA